MAKGYIDHPCNWAVRIRIIEAVVEEKKSLGGIILETEGKSVSEKLYKDRSQCRGEVLEIGPNAFLQYGTEPWFKVGDLVGFCENGARVANDRYGKPTERLVNESEVYSILEEIEIEV